VKKIQLTSNKVAIVDDSDFEWLSRWKWFAQWDPSAQSYYAARHDRLPDGKRYPVYMARLILGLKRGDPRQADHIHHNTLDNRRSEIRIVTSQGNNWNRANIKGYTWNKLVRKYQAQIKINDQNIYLGCFANPVDAHNAYLAAKTIYHRIP
jgi:hypothetical protein